MATDVVLLGTGTPRTVPGSSGPATAVIVDGVPYVFDCGPGAGIQISAGFHRGIEGLAMSGVEHVFITHLHSDHTLGLASLMLTPWMFGRSTPLVVRGPLGTAAMARHVAAAYEADVAKRIHGEPLEPGGHEVVATDIGPGVVHEDDRVSVVAIAVEHGDWVEAVHGPTPALGYRVRSADRTVVISGDTGVFPSMEATYGECDVLVHEVYSSAGLASRPARWRAYHERAHTSGGALGRLATRLQPGILVLTHQLLWNTPEAELVDEVTAVYDGEVRYGRDLDVI